MRYFHRTFYRVPFLVPYWDAQELGAIRRAARPQAGDGEARSRRALELVLGRLSFPHVVLTATGRFALEAALRSLNRPRGEVIVPAFACRAIAAAVLGAGCIPVFADINQDLTLSAKSVEANLTTGTVAVVVLHLSGKPAADFDDLLDLCRAEGLALVDDAAQALGVLHRGRPLGSFGDFGILSFGLGKPTFSVGGGALVVPSATAKRECDAIVDAAGDAGRSRLRELGAIASFLLQYRYRRQTLPFFLASRLLRKQLRRRLRRERRGPITGLEAELQVIQLGKLSEIIRRFRDNGHRVVASLAPDAGIVAPQASADCAYTKLLLRAPSGSAARLAEHLLRKGVEIEWSYRPLDLVDEFRAFRRGPNPCADCVWPDLLAVPDHPGLSPGEVEYVASAVASFRGRR